MIYLSISSGDWEEFFVGMLQPEVHFVQVKTVNDIVPAVQRLRANASHARRIAAAGRAFALHQLSYDQVLLTNYLLLTTYHDQVLAYVRALLRGYAARQSHAAPPSHSVTATRPSAPPLTSWRSLASVRATRPVDAPPSARPRCGIGVQVEAEGPPRVRRSAVSGGTARVQHRPR